MIKTVIDSSIVSQVSYLIFFLLKKKTQNRNNCKIRGGHLEAAYKEFRRENSYG